jgi:DNA-binding transcriptional ArsR family regulator
MALSSVSSPQSSKLSTTFVTNDVPGIQESASGMGNPRQPCVGDVALTDSGIGGYDILTIQPMFLYYDKVREDLETMPSHATARKKPAASHGGKPAMAFAQKVSWLLKNVGDATRMQILLSLTEGKRSLGEICERVGMQEAALYHHLVLLRQAKVVDSRHEGENTVYQLTELGSRFVASALCLVDQGDVSPTQVIGQSKWKKLVKEAGAVVDDPEYWLNMPNPQFEWRRPIDLIGTEDEERVHIVIAAARQGLFA